MVHMMTRLKVADNSGAKEVMCIDALSKKSGIGDVITVSIKDAIPRGKVQKGDVCKAVIVRTREMINREEGDMIKFDENAVVILNNQGQPVGTRVFGVIAKELRARKFLKLISLAKEVL